MPTTFVRIMRGRCKGSLGWISGTLEDRTARGVTKALVHTGDEVDLFAIASLCREDQHQLELTLPADIKKPAASPSGPTAGG